MSAQRSGRGSGRQLARYGAAPERVFIRGREMPKETRQTELLKKYRTIGR